MTFEFPPTAFSNHVNDLKINFDWKNWRQSNEWKIFVAGYNAAVKESNQAVLSRYNMGETAERLFKRNEG